MGAGQIGGIATLLDIDFENAAGFAGTIPSTTEAQYAIHYFSHAMIFCMGVLIEPHVVLTPAMCVYSERFEFTVIGGTHMFFEHTGIYRQVKHVCIHRGYNHTMRWQQCGTANLALLVVKNQFSFSQREEPADYIINRIRYGIKPKPTIGEALHCQYYGWGSRRNGYLIPLLINMRRMDVTILPQERCAQIWNYDSHFLCLEQRPCKSNKFGALCPDDVGSVIECSGYAVGMMVSRLVDRPCGVGFLDLSKFQKFLTCGVDDSRDVIDHDAFMSIDFATFKTPPTRSKITVPNGRDNGKQTSSSQPLRIK